MPYNIQQQDYIRTNPDYSQKLHNDNEIFGIYINVINHKDIHEWTDKINNAIRNF